MGFSTSTHTYLALGVQRELTRFLLRNYVYDCCPSISKYLMTHHCFSYPRDYGGLLVPICLHLLIPAWSVSGCCPYPLNMGYLLRLQSVIFLLVSILRHLRLILLFGRDAVREACAPFIQFNIFVINIAFGDMSLSSFTHGAMHSPCVMSFLSAFSCMQRQAISAASRRQ
jgi:hypothetical protein